jgi:lipopolysaccharide transport system ATP-binding protein
MSDYAIKVEGLGKKYLLQHQASGQRYTALRDVLAEKAKSLFRNRKSEIGNRKSVEDFWALQDVSFEVKPGEVVGIIGRNGAGKSTLLKLLSRITEPTTGQIRLRGRVASLLEVGTGFHPELTGRENIFLNGAVLGMHRSEIKKRFDEIVDFAEVEKFLDTPVKRYSSGMYMRLAFAVAAHLEPEILIVDEVLAVGDAQFQKKCLGKMGEVSKGGRTVLFVSHNMAAIQQLTKKCLLLKQGAVLGYGETAPIVGQYFDLETNSARNVYPIDSRVRRIPCSRAVEFLEVALLNPLHHLIPNGEPLKIQITLRGNQAISAFRFGITISQISGVPVGNAFSLEELAIGKDETAVFELQLGQTRLAPGRYQCGLSIGKGNQETGIQDFDIVLEVLHFEITPSSGPAETLGTWNPNWGAIAFPTPSVVKCTSQKI